MHLLSHKELERKRIEQIFLSEISDPVLMRVVYSVIKNEFMGYFMIGFLCFVGTLTEFIKPMPPTGNKVYILQKFNTSNLNKFLFLQI